MLHRFFALGSFSRGQIHYPKISELISAEKRAFVKGEVFRLRCGYPALVPGEGELIPGQLCEIEAPESYFAVLDSLLQFDPQRADKCFFQRKTVTVHVDNFTQVSAETYCLNPKKLMSAHKKITGGDWKTNLLRHPPINMVLQDRQKEYIHKLSCSKGRDIVPIKLDLYRELMNLELIVDKGRRLALTPMGKEAALFMET